MKKLWIVIAMLFVSVAGVFAQTDLQALAVVKLSKNETITVKQFKLRAESVQKQNGKKLTLEEKKLLLDAFIEERLILQAAQKDGLSITDSMVDEYFIQSMSQMIGVNVTEKELGEYIKKSQGITLDQFIMNMYGMNVADFKAYLKNSLLVSQYVRVKRQNELSQVAPTDEEIRMFYESNKASFVWNDMMRVFLVIVPKGSDIDAARIKLNGLRNQFIDKKTSLEMMVASSKDNNSGYQAGEMIIPKVESYAVSLGMAYSTLLGFFGQDEGFVSDMWETSTDFRFMSIRKKYAAKMLSLSDVYQPETTVTLYEYIRAVLANNKQSAYLQTAAQEIAAELNTPDNVERKKTGAALDKLLDWGE